MRDFGGVRNVVYNFEANTDSSARVSEGATASTVSAHKGLASPEVYGSPSTFTSPYKPKTKLGNIDKELKIREAVLRKRCGVGQDYDFNFSKQPEDPYDEFYSKVKANDATKNISSPLFSAGLLNDDWDTINDASAFKE
jgi:hypothetical protein